MTLIYLQYLTADMTEVITVCIHWPLTFALFLCGCGSYSLHMLCFLVNDNSRPVLNEWIPYLYNVINIYITSLTVIIFFSSELNICITGYSWFITWKHFYMEATITLFKRITLMQVSACKPHSKRQSTYRNT